MLHRIMLFISSYIPLYVLLIIKNIIERITIDGRLINIAEKIKNCTLFDEINDYAIVGLTLLCIASYLYLKSKIKTTQGEKNYIIIDISDETSNFYFNYISIYLLSCLGLTLSKISDVFVLCFLMVIVGYIYISNGMTYMNPILQFMGYKAYDAKIKSVSTGEDVDSIVIANRKMKINTGNKILATGKGDFIFTKEVITKVE